MENEANLEVQQEKEKNPYGTSANKRKYTTDRVAATLARVHWQQYGADKVYVKKIQAMPAAAKAAMARDPLFIEYLEAYAVDVLFGARKPTKEEWAAHQFLCAHLGLKNRVGKGIPKRAHKVDDSVLDVQAVDSVEVKPAGVASGT